MAIDGKFTTPFLTKSVATAAGAIVAVVAAGYVLGGGCGEESNDLITGGSATKTAMALTSSVDAASGVTGMEFKVERVACESGESFDPFMYEFAGDLEDMDLPSGLEAVHGPAEGSSHKFADHFVVLDAGCYDVTATPLSDAGVSASCSAAFAENVLVQDGKTTEVLLLSQCDGKERGALDVIAALNTAPHIETVVYNPSKFVGVCEDVEICVTAKDPEGDPLDIELARVDGPNSAGVPTSVGSSPVDGGMTECFTIEPTAVGSYEYEITVYDLLPTEEGGMMRFDDYLTELGSDKGSKDTLTLPVHVGDTDEEFECGAGEPTPEPDAGDPTDTLGDDDDRDPPSDCVDYTNSDLRKTIDCKINGGQVRFTLPADSCDETISLSSYALNGNDIIPFEKQVLFDNVTDIYGGGTFVAEVDVPEKCGYQLDLYTGEVLQTPMPRIGHGDRLLCATAVVDKDCEGTLGDDDERPDECEAEEDEVAAENPGKVAICHIPPGNPENAHTIVVDEHAVPAHLDHGDILGVCSCVDIPTDGDDDDDDGDDDDGDDDDGDDDDGDDGDDDDVCPDSCQMTTTMASQANSFADITVAFRCDEVYVESTKDLSNVVVLYDNGTIHKFDNLDVGMTGTFGLDDEGTVVTVWVKSGSFQSGDGPGYGVRFDLAQCTALN